MRRWGAFVLALLALCGFAWAATEADRQDCAADKDADTKIAACTRVIEDPTSSPAVKNMAYRNRGNSYGNKRLHDLATFDFDEALKIDPQDRLSLGGRGKSYSNRGQYDRAIADFTSIIRLYPDTERAYNERGLLHLRKGDIDAALADFDAALRINPRYVHAHNNRGLVLVRKGRLDEAIASYVETLRLDPDYLLAYLNRGRALEARGDLEQALADFKHAADGRPREKLDEDQRGKTLGAKEFKRLTAAIADGKAKTKAERRVALVIGNGRYANAPPLRNPVNDAKAIAVALRASGFTEVREVYDADLATLGRVLRDFGDLATGADWAVIYYAGHGIEIGNVNYLIPVDARLQHATHVEDETIPLSRVTSKVLGATKLQLVILDACRNSPFLAGTAGRITRSIGSGLAPIDPEGAMMIAYAAKDGTTALDGERDNSPYAEALVRHLGEPGLEVSQLFRKVRDDVFNKTGKQQEPYTYGSLPAQPFYFRR